MLEIDGSIGGGSVIRLAIPLAIALELPIKIINIRKHRKNPGLRTQHLIGVKLLASLSNSKLVNAELGSSTIEFYPLQGNEGFSFVKKTANNTYAVDIHTAGAISLLIQNVSNYLFASNSSNNIKLQINGGGTHVSWSPNFDYLDNVSIKAFELFNQDLEIFMDKPGFYPKGDAIVSLNISQKTISDKILLTPNEELSRSGIDVKVTSIASKHLKRAQVAERQIKGAKMQLKKDPRINKITEVMKYYDSASIGSSLTISYTNRPYFKGADQLGSKGLRAEDVGRKAATKFLSELDSDATVDQHLADQLILPVVISNNSSVLSVPSITDHVNTNLQVLNQILNRKLTIKPIENHFILADK